MKRFLLLTCLLTVICNAVAAQEVFCKTDVKYYKLDLNVDPNVKIFDGKTSIYFTVNEDYKLPIAFELNNSFKVSEIRSLSDNKKLKFSHNEHKIVIYPNKNWKPTDSISVKYQGKPVSSDWGSVVFSKHADVPAIWTLSCPYNAKDWFVCKQDLTDKADSATLIVTCPKQFKSAGCGLLVKDTIINNKRTSVWHHRYPIDYYLLCLACTNYEVFSENIPLQDGTSVEMLNYVYPEYLDQAKKLSKDLIPIFQLYCDLFGKYPFSDEKYGQAQFDWGGGMEHQTMSFVTNFEVMLTAHELSHHWFGDNITCQSYKDIWLNESFATYCEYLAVEKGLTPKSKEDWLKFTNFRATKELDGSVYVYDTTDCWKIFDYDHTYCKGGLALHMLRTEIGDKAFFKCVKEYATDPKLQKNTAKAEDFIRHAEEASGRDLKWFFDQWIFGEGFPFFIVDWNYSKDGTLKIRINQKHSMNQSKFFRLKLPIEIKYGNGDSEQILVDNTEQNQIIVLKTDQKPSEIIVNPKNEIITKEPVVQEIDF